MRAVFHLLTIFVKVVEPEAIRICRTRLWNLAKLSSSTLRKHWAVRSFVTFDPMAVCVDQRRGRGR